MPLGFFQKPTSESARYKQLGAQSFLPYKEESSEGSDAVSDTDGVTQTELPRYRRTNWIRLSLYIIIGLAIGITLGLGSAWVFWDRRPMSRLSKVKEFAPQMPLSTVVFEEIPELYEAPSRESDAYWDSLVPPGKGFVQIPNPEDYNLKPGILTQTSVERYSVTMYHELHCLALLRRYYWHLVDAVSNGWHEDARQEMVREQLYNHHPHHCFAYLAQGIMCNADLTMEWARVEKDGRRFQVEGWGIPHHQCKDPKAVREWADKHHSPARPNSTHIDGSHG